MKLYCLSQNIPGGYTWTKPNHTLGYEMWGYCNAGTPAMTISQLSL